MAELIIKAIDSTNSVPMTSKKGMLVTVRPDSWPWGSGEGLPTFVLIKIPGVSVEKVLKYFVPWLEEDGITLKEKRLWRIRWDDLPPAAKSKLKNNGMLTIKAGTYSGSYDYTWTQFKIYFRNLLTNTDETEEL